jgi:hypothetical protein
VCVCVIVCDLATPTTRRIRPDWALALQKEKYVIRYNSRTDLALHRLYHYMIGITCAYVLTNSMEQSLHEKLIFLQLV